MVIIRTALVMFSICHIIPARSPPAMNPAQPAVDLPGALVNFWISWNNIGRMILRSKTQQFRTPTPQPPTQRLILTACPVLIIMTQMRKNKAIWSKTLSITRSTCAKRWSTMISITTVPPAAATAMCSRNTCRSAQTPCSRSLMQLIDITPCRSRVQQTN